MSTVGRLVKESIVEDVSSHLSEESNVFVTAVNRLKASDADVFRQKLYATHAHLIVVKRRLGQRTVSQLKITGLPELLEGSVGLIFAKGDVLPTAKLIMEFRKTHEEQLIVRGALVDGQLLDTARVEALAKLPPKPVLLAEVLGMIEAPIAQLIMTIEQLIGDVAWIAEQAAAAKPQPAPQAEGQASAPSAPADAQAAQPQGGTTPPAAS